MEYNTERADYWTRLIKESDLIKTALDIQDASNLRAVVRVFGEALQSLSELGLSTNKHRICRLYASKIQSLTGDVLLHDFDYPKYE